MPDRAPDVKRVDLRVKNEWSLSDGTQRARDFEVRLAPEPDSEWSSIWQETQPLQIGDTAVIVKLSRDNLSFYCSDAIIENLVLAIDQAVADANGTVRRRHEERAAGEPERRRVDEENRRYAEDFKQRLGRIPRPE